MNKPYKQSDSKVLESIQPIKHVMALNLNPKTNYKDGLVRCVVDRSGNISQDGFVDRSELRLVSSSSHDDVRVDETLKISGSDEVIGKLCKNGWDFIGFEDPDIWFDENTKLLHVYFTLPIRASHTLIHLGHAVGQDLRSLTMTDPVLVADEKSFVGAKELSVAPMNSKRFRYNLVESNVWESDFNYSVVRVAICEDMGKPWMYGETVFHPKKHNISWIGGHASPGPLLPESFMKIGKGKRLGFMNGREANRREGAIIKYGIFSVGLYIYDYEKGKIDWVSSEPLIRDSEAKTITFASQFIQTGKVEGILYAHIDDSFVRSYTIYASLLRSLLPID